MKDEWDFLDKINLPVFDLQQKSDSFDPMEETHEKKKKSPTMNAA